MPAYHQFDITQTTTSGREDKSMFGIGKVSLSRGAEKYLLTSAVMERDLRLTGSLRGQSDAVEAPAGFEGR